MTRVRVTILIALIVAACLPGCSFEPPPDPNDPKQVSIQQPTVMLRRLKWASDAANRRVANGEISEVQAKQLVSDVAKSMTSAIPMQRIPPGEAWEYAEVCRTARDWKKALEIFKVAVQNPANEDRRINDTLRMAHCQAELGDVKNAINSVRSTLDAKEHDSAPLLPAVLYEIVPAAMGKGQDAELAKLLRETVRVFEKTVVDASTDAGKAFLIARPVHISKALQLASDLERRPKSEIRT